MDELPLIFLIIVAGILLGMACKAMTATEEEQGDADKPELSPRHPSSSPSDASPGEPVDPNTKDCKSCGGHSQTGQLCSFCGRAL